MFDISVLKVQKYCTFMEQFSVLSVMEGKFLTIPAQLTAMTFVFVIQAWILFMEKCVVLAV